MYYSLSDTRTLAKTETGLQWESCSFVGRQPLESICMKVNVENVLRAKRRPSVESLPVIPPGKLSLMSKLRRRQELFEIKENRGEKIQKKER